RNIVTETFLREATFYSDISNLMSKENFKNESKSITAKCMYTNMEPSHEVIVLDDLKKRGFRVTKVALGLDLKHCLLVMRTVAHYHASTVKRIKHCFNPSWIASLSSTQMVVCHNSLTPV
ncbi:hypothetical protein L9F63_024936, partial [Diploptera punctata]